LLQKLGGSRGPAAGGAAAEFGQALGCLLTGGGFPVVKQDCPQDVAVLGLGGTSMLGSPDAKAAHDIVIKVPDSESRHWSNSPNAVNHCNDSI
jgi:hypothetical protein